MSIDPGSIQLLALGILVMSTIAFGSTAIIWWRSHFRTSQMEARRHGIASGAPQNSNRRRLRTLGRHLSVRTQTKPSSWTGAKASVKFIDLPPDLELQSKQIAVILVIVFMTTSLLCLISGIHIGVAAIIATIVMLIMRRLAVSHLISRRQKNFTDGFNDAIETILRSTKVGVPLTRALQLATVSATPVVRYELTQVVSRMDLGEPFGEAVARLETAIPTREVKLFVTCLKLQIQTGASISESLENVLDILRKRRTLALKITAITSEARSSAIAIASMVPLFAIGMLLLMPRYFDPLFSDATGNYVALSCVGSLIAGVVMIIRLGRPPL